MAVIGSIIDNKYEILKLIGRGEEDKYMAGILSVDYEGAKDNVVTPIQTEIGNLAQAASEISRLMGELPNYWSGTSYDTADAKYHDEYQDFIEVKVPEIMGEFNQYMRILRKRMHRKR